MKIKRKRNILKTKYIIFICVGIIAIILVGLFAIPKQEINIENDISVTTENIVGLSSEIQREINNDNKNNMDSNVQDGETYIVNEDLGVYLPLVDWTNDMDEEDEANVLSTSALTYPKYGNAGKGNLIVFGHNSGLYSQGYFTPFVENLEVGDTVMVKTKKKNYKYKITSREIVEDNEIEKVFYESDEPIITIGTCDIPSATTNKRIIWTGTLEN